MNRDGYGRELTNAQQTRTFSNLGGPPRTPAAGLGPGPFGVIELGLSGQRGKRREPGAGDPDGKTELRRTVEPQVAGMSLRSAGFETTRTSLLGRAWRLHSVGRPVGAQPRKSAASRSLQTEHEVTVAGRVLQVSGPFAS